MTNFRGIQADYVDYRTVKGRKVLQIFFEVPLENAKQVHEMLGYPQPGESRWCAIALLEGMGEPEATPPCKEEIPNGTVIPYDPSGPMPPARRKFSELPLSQQAALRCAQSDFWAFLSCKDEIQAAIKVRSECGVLTRADLDDLARAAARAQWTALEARYQSYLTDRQYGGVRK